MAYSVSYRVRFFIPAVIASPFRGVAIPQRGAELLSQNDINDKGIPTSLTLLGMTHNKEVYV